MNIDPGTSTSIITIQYYDQYFANFKLYKYNIELCTLAGNKLHNLNKIYFSVKYNVIQKKLTMLVVRSTLPCPM